MRHGLADTRTVIEVAIAAHLATWLAATPGCAASSARGPDVRKNVHTVQMAIEQWAVDHGGRYPTTAADYRKLLMDRPFRDATRDSGAIFYTPDETGKRYFLYGAPAKGQDAVFLVNHLDLTHR